MSNCINVNHPEFQSLIREANINPLILKSKVGVWQTANNTDRFPTLKELGISHSTILAKTTPLNSEPLINIEDQGKPINNTDNFNSFRNYKLELIQNLEKNLKQYKNFNKSISGSQEYRDKVKEFNNTITDLKNEVGKMDIKDATQMFHSFIKEINDLYELVKGMSPEDYANYEVDSRLDNILQLLTNKDIHGKIHNHDYVDGTQFEHFDKVIEGLHKLEDLYNLSYGKITEEVLKSNPVYVSNVGKMNSEEREKFEEGIAKLANSGQKDINMLSGMFMGINSVNDSIATIAANLTLQFNMQKVQQVIAKTLDKLTVLDGALHNKKFDFNKFFLKDKFGVDTGYLVHIFSPEYFKEIGRYYEFRKALRTSQNKDKLAHYRKMVNWLKNNAEVIDFTKLKYFKDKYESSYGNYFEHSDSEMEEYENQLKSLLGKYFDIVVQEIDDKLDNFNEFRYAQENSNNIYKDRNIMENSPWDFIKHYNSENYMKLVDVEVNGEPKKALLQSNYISFVPKENLNGMKLGYYDDSFKAIQEDSDAFDYWSTVREIYNKHIDPVYSSIGHDMHRMSYAKVQKSLEEILYTKNEKPWTEKLYKELVRMYKEIWVDSRKVKIQSDIVARNYTDTSKKAIKKVKELLELRDIEELKKLATDRKIEYNDKLVTKKELVDTIARYDVLQVYSKDLTKVTQAIATAASEHRARLETAHLAELFKRFHENIKTINNKDRNNSNKRFEAWINTNIYNHRKVEDTLQEDLDSSKRFMKAYSQTDKKMLDLINEIKKNGPKGDTTFTYNEFRYLQNKGKTYRALDKGEYTPIKQEVFDDALEQYLNSRIKELGLPINLHSLWNGVLKTIIIKGLSFNPKSGVFNRLEGTFTNMVRDNAGDYWTPGNLAVAKNFMSFINMYRISDSRLAPFGKSKKLQVQTFMHLFEKLGVYEDKKNELDRRDNVSRFNKIGSKLELLTYGLAVDLPEFKNQGEIILSMLMDLKVKDVNGNIHDFFDKKKMEFTLFEPGTTNVKNEFRTPENLGWETFELNADPSKNDFFVARVKIDDTIKKTQGNYSKLDSIQAQDSLLGRSLMTFMRWMPEHIFQRFGTRDFDVIQGKNKVVGRYAATYNNPAASGILATFLATAIFGPGSVIPIGAGLGGVVLPYILKMFNSQKIAEDKQMVLHSFSMKVVAGMLQEVLIQSLNFPMKFGHTKFEIKPLVKNFSLEKSSEIGDLKPEEVKAIKGMCQEIANGIAITLIMIGMKTLLQSLIAGGDDEDEVERHSKDMDKIAETYFYNYISNSGDRLITSFTAWASPSTFFTQNSKVAAIRALDEVGKLFSMIEDYHQGKKQGAAPLINEFNKAIPLVPIPNPINDVIFKGQYPFFDQKNYTTDKWYDKMFLDPEKAAKSKLTSERALIKQDLQEKYIEQLQELYKGNSDVTQYDIEQEAEDMVSKDLKGTYKKKNESYKDALERFEEEKKALE